MSAGIAVTGIGAVSPAGWGIEPLRAALQDGAPALEIEPWRRAEDAPLCLRRVAAEPNPRPAYFGHPRLRRAPWVARMAAGALFEAVEESGVESRVAPERIALVFAAMNGSVSYSRRFYQEVLTDAATASPLLFPETVYNSPASHLSSARGWSGPNQTLVGDSAGFIQALDLAAQWLVDGEADAVAVISAEEFDWVCAEALDLVETRPVSAEGAGALILENASDSASGITLEAVCASRHVCADVSRDAAAAGIRQELGGFQRDALLVSGSRGHARGDRAEACAWADWTGGEIAPGRVLGEAYVVNGAWQCVAAVDALRHGSATRALVPVTGSSERACGAVFGR